LQAFIICDCGIPCTLSNSVFLAFASFCIPSAQLTRL